MEQLIPIASKLQDVLGAVGHTTSLNLPEIVVVGGQSSGKSSVLESLVGRSFLPRGTGIVTRRPLILQLFNTADTSSTGSKQSKDKEATPNEWGEFLHKPDQKYYDFGAIRSEIVAETDRLTGNNKGIDSTPIRLKVYSPRVLALTLVDLPGIAKIPVGDQPHDIERQIQQMCVKYISNPNAIILAVTSANTDIANSDALKLAASIDPEGNRTVGVLTKVDLMDDGTDCADILMNQVIPLRRGYIAVVNRGQKEVKNDASIRDGLKKEERFFRKHPVYSSDTKLLGKCGTGYLAKALNTMLMHHIRDCLPDLKARITNMMTDVHKQLDDLGTSLPGRSARGALLLSLLSKFASNFARVLEGRVGQDLGSSSRLTDKSHSAAGVELMGGARISYIFTQVFASSLSSVGAFDGLTDGEIRTIISNANGTRPALFVPEISFDIIVRRQVARLEQPGIQCVDLIFEELQRIASQSEPAELQRFPVLRDRMTAVVASLLRRCVSPTQMMVANLVKIELAYINTSHPDFIGGSRAVARLMEQMGKENKGSIVAATPRAAVNKNATTTRDENNADATSKPDDADTTNPGLMNFIFGGGNHPTTGPTTPRTPLAPTTPAGDDTPTQRSNLVHLPPVPQTMKQTDFDETDRERVEMQVIKSLVESYFGIVRKNFVDLVPKVYSSKLILLCF